LKSHLLLKGRVEEPFCYGKRRPYKLYGALACLSLAVVVLFIGRGLQGQAQAGAFVGGGMFLLGAGLLWCWYRLEVESRDRRRNIATPIDLAASNAKRAPTRSILAISLVAVASFLILSMSLFQASPTAPGLGGFQLMGRSQSPIYDELGNPKTRRDAARRGRKALMTTQIVSMRLRGGDDASCNNLYQADEPQVLGISRESKRLIKDRMGDLSLLGFRPNQSNAWESLEEEAAGIRIAHTGSVGSEHSPMGLAFRWLCWRAI
jgi:putative ABC transport system permease protein